jgi:hypothetical protein
MSRENNPSMRRPAIVAAMRKRFPWWMSLIVLAPALSLAGLAAKDPLCGLVFGGGLSYIFSGKIFTEPFNIIHAGCAMDQPTIGKWLIWFAILTLMTVPMLLAGRLLNDRGSTARYWAFAAPAVAVTILLLSILIPPVCLLVQYVYWMGFTPLRVAGLAGAAAGFIGLVSLCWWNVRRPHTTKFKQHRLAESL